MSPYQMMIILHAHCSPSQPYDGTNAPIYHDVMQQLTDLELFEKNAFGYEPTERLHVYCKALCSMPLPVQTWSMTAIPNLSYPIAEAKSD